MQLELSPTDQLAIYEAAVRYLLQVEPHCHQTVYRYLLIDSHLVGGRPSSARWEAGPIPAGLSEALQDVAACVEVAEPTMDLLYSRVFDPSKGAIYVALGPLQLHTDGSVELVAGLSNGPEAGAGVEFRLERQGCVWRVVDSILRWLS